MAPRALQALALALAAVMHLPCARTLAAATVAVVRVRPGELHLCSRALEAEAQDGARARTVRCVLGPGTYRDRIEHFGSGRLEVVGSGGGATVMEGSTPVTGAGVSWVPAHLPHLNTTNSLVWSAKLPPPLRIPNVQQAFVDGGWISEARFPNTNLDKVLSLNSWAFCGKGTYHGFCKDRPDRYARLAGTMSRGRACQAHHSLAGRAAAVALQPDPCPNTGVPVRMRAARLQMERPRGPQRQLDGCPRHALDRRALHHVHTPGNQPHADRVSLRRAARPGARLGRLAKAGRAVLAERQTGHAASRCPRCPRRPALPYCINFAAFLGLVCTTAR